LLFEVSDGKKWVDSVYKFDEKVGRLFMVAAYRIKMMPL
jgi:hypothetical protein